MVPEWCPNGAGMTTSPRKAASAGTGPESRRGAVAGATPPLAIHVLQPMAFDGIGPSQTCLWLCEAAGRLGADVHAYGTRRRTERPRHSQLYLPFGNIGLALPYQPSADFLQSRIERRILEEVPAGAILHVWPSLTLPTFRELKRRGCFVAVEMINLHTRTEKRIIEDEMARENFHYRHYVTDDKIETQRQMLAAADLIFASNPQTEQSLAEQGIAPGRIVATRYGAAMRHERRDYAAERPVFAFVGRINLEKGVHHLLRAWRAAGLDGELHLYGRVDPEFAKRYGDLLGQPSVVLKGFSREISDHYRTADCFIFLSLAEGGPLVSIEAAAHGLPMIVSPMGGGRLAEDGRTAMVVDPACTTDVAAAIRLLGHSASLRQRLGRAAFARSAEFTWEVAAAERLAAIRAAVRAPG